MDLSNLYKPKISVNEAVYNVLKFANAIDSRLVAKDSVSIFARLCKDLGLEGRDLRRLITKSITHWDVFTRATIDCSRYRNRLYENKEYQTAILSIRADPLKYVPMLEEIIETYNAARYPNGSKDVQVEDTLYTLRRLIQ